ncbi:PREDICTED: uncharacterized protein LOC108573510 [Habropoda laboriosa]|uniref:uncharacterized protein LOC108573510 n=1 Tax=Habropoda laboriosa TaxID=597456 RepID=UPI00083CDA5C|nr:PREDICTED: uncharacterized protein LOC108573510 [Habropoda laboriosa]
MQKQFFDFQWDPAGSIAQHISKLQQLANKIKALGGIKPEDSTVVLTSNLKVQPDSSKNTNFTKKKKRLSCFTCGSKEHLKKNCPKKREQRRDYDGPCDRQAFVGGTDQRKNENCWLIDSGTSDHMTR